jgi:hypothetical protein
LSSFRFAKLQTWRVRVLSVELTAKIPDIFPCPVPFPQVSFPCRFMKCDRKLRADGLGAVPLVVNGSAPSGIPLYQYQFSSIEG